YLGWPSIFYTFGGLSCVRCICWFFIAYDTPEQHPRISAAEKKYIQDSLTGLALVLLVAGRAALGCPCSVIFCNLVDIAPKYAGLLVGVASTFSSAAGLLGPAIAGIITEHVNRYIR
ncbi:uncharacterized protein LOC141910358, partial [Tubulanus polymorphus]|uniref:uncharacterized protein LOC141910358 n=1 Tax=Tubulanus polymorphus TaxID=672921 RepID=UPI003DA68F17